MEASICRLDYCMKVICFVMSTNRRGSTRYTYKQSHLSEKMHPKTLNKTLISTTAINVLLGAMFIICDIVIMANGLFSLTVGSALFLLQITMFTSRLVILKHLRRGKQWAWGMSILINFLDVIGPLFPLACINLVGLLQQQTREYFLSNGLAASSNH